MVNVAYDLNDDAMIYATYSEGFKSGGFDQRYNVEFLDGPTSFEPETATSYELGLKSTWLDNRLRMNVAAFFTDYQDQQIIVREGFAPITLNAGESEIKGIEIETSFVPSEAWLLQASVGYIDAQYTELDQVVLDNSPINKDTALAQTPEWSTNLGVAYTQDVAGWGYVTPRLDWSYKSEVYNDAINTPQLRQGAYHIVNASISFVSVDEAWEIILSGRNLNSELYLTTGVSAYDTGAAYTEGVFSRETQWSLSGRYNF
jgi:iron complex outermembrane receptor protein